MHEQPIKVKKKSGKTVPYDENKLRHSLERSGAVDEIIEEITQEVSQHLYEGISTKEIYKRAFKKLKKYSSSSAGRYQLKNAIFELGPTGYPFESFVGEILKHQGFSVQVGVKLQGYCVTHEIDVLAKKDVKHYMVECKFHNEHQKQCDVKVPLYINSRFEDLQRQWEQAGNSEKVHQGLLFTNTRFSEDAINYGNCVGLIMVGWDYPDTGSLKERIDLAGVHPITCLTTLTKKEKQDLLSREVVLCKQIAEKSDQLTYLGISSRRQKKILREAEELCTTNT